MCIFLYISVPDPQLRNLFNSHMGDNREISQISFAVGEQYSGNMYKAANSNLWTLFYFIFLSLRFVLCISHLDFILLALMLLFVIPGWDLFTGKTAQKDLHFLCACHCLWSLLLPFSNPVVLFTDVEKNGKETVAI